MIDNIRVVITETTSVNAGLSVGVAEESITITSAAPLAQADGAQLGRMVDSRAVAELPLATRNFTQILGLSPGAATYLPDNTSVGRNSQNISVNGARVTNNNFQINGVDANSMGTNSAPSLSIPAPETIQEFKVQTSLYDATFGRSGGGNIQAVTKSGTNEFHGAVYEFLIPTPQANGRYTGSTPSSYREDQFNANLDWRANERNTLAGKFFFFNAPQTLTLPSFLGGGPNVPGFGNFQVNNGRIATLQYTRVFSASVINEARVGYNFLRVDAFPQQPINDAGVGVKRANADVFPGLGWIRIAAAAGGITFGTSPTIDVLATAPSTTFYDAVSITRGKHTIRTGAELRYNENNYTLNFFTRGQIDFLNFNNFLTGNTFVSVFGSGIGDRSLRATDYNFFAQDDWKISTRLTLNLGLRYELDLPPYDTRGRLATFDPALYKPRPLVVGGAPVGPPIGGYVQAGNVIQLYDSADIPNVGKRVVNSVDPNNFAPRVGFAYSRLDSGRFVIRGGYGVYYSRTSFQYITLNVIAPPTYVFGARVGAPFEDPYFPAPAPGQFPTLAPGVALSGTLFDRNLHTPYLHQYNANVQYELAKNLLLEVGYVGTRGLNLFRQVGINQARLATPQNPVTNEVLGTQITTNTPGNALLRAPFQGVGISNFFQNQSTGQSGYNSSQASVTKRLSRGRSS